MSGQQGSQSATGKRPLRSMALIGVGLLMLVGCAAGTGMGSFSGADPLDATRRQYAQGRFAAAVQSGQQAYLSGHGDRHEAAYLVGLASHQRGDLSTARQYLNRATQSSNRTLAGQAYAALGLVHHDAGWWQPSYRALNAAAVRLSGHQRALAYFHAGVALQKAGKWAAARLSLQRAAGASGIARFDRRCQRQSQFNAFAVQIGSFRRLEAGRRAIEGVTQKSPSVASLPSRLVPVLDRQNRRWFRAQIGAFSTFDQAEMARRSWAGASALVVPTTVHRNR